MSNSTALPDLSFDWPLLPAPSIVSRVKSIVSVVSSIVRSPITDRVWKGTGSLPIVSLVMTRPHLTKNCR